MDSHEKIGLSVWDGLARSFPIVVTYLAIGTATGVLGAEYGMSVLEVCLLSFIVFAGSAQFAFPPLYMGSLPALVFTIFYINIRHLVYSLALSLHTKRLGMASKVLIGAQLTDETFLVSSSALESRQIHNPFWMLSINVPSNISWIVGNGIGAYSASLIDFSVLGVEFAPIGMFLCLILLQAGIDNRKHQQGLITALVAGGATFGAYLLGMGHLSLIVVAPLAALLCTVALGSIPQDAFLSKQEDK